MKKSFKNYVKLLVLGFASVAQGAAINAMKETSKTLAKGVYGYVDFRNVRKSNESNIIFNNVRKKSVSSQNLNKINPENQNDENQKEPSDDMHSEKNNLGILKGSVLNLSHTQNAFKNFNATRFVWSNNNCQLSSILHALSNPITLRDIKNKQEKNLPLNILEEMVLELAGSPFIANGLDLEQLKVSKSRGEQKYYYQNNPDNLFNYPNKYVEVTNNLDSIFKSTFNPGNSSLQLVAPLENTEDKYDVCIAKLFSGDLYKDGKHYAHSFCVIPVYKNGRLIGGLAMNSNPGFKEYYYFVVSAEEFRNGHIKTPFLGTSKDYTCAGELYASKKDFEGYHDFWSLEKVNSILHPYGCKVSTDNLI